MTDRIDTFTERGVKLQSGRELEADIVVTATGLSLLAFGGIHLSVDGVPVNVPEKVAFKGFMLSDVPNFVYVFGYTNSSWTLKVGLICEHFCRLLAHMDARGHTICFPRFPESMATQPLLDISANYVQRSVDQFPRQGVDAPWRTCMDYRADYKMLRDGPVNDDNLCFRTSSSAGAREAALSA